MIKEAAGTARPVQEELQPGAHLGVQAEGAQQGLAWPHAPQVKDNGGELITDKDILIIQGQLQNVLRANRNKQPKMKRQKH